MRFAFVVLRCGDSVTVLLDDAALEKCTIQECLRLRVQEYQV